MADLFSNHVRRIRKILPEAHEDRISVALRDSFFQQVLHLPEDMRYDLFDYFLETTDFEIVEYRGFDTLTERLRAVIALFLMDFSPTDDIFTADDWTYLKEIVNDYALDMDDSALLYIMKLIVEKGHFDT
jgi:hypothetical protein